MSFKEGKERANHKYIARVRIEGISQNNKYRYFYTQPQYRAYLYNKNNKSNKTDKLITTSTAVKKVENSSVNKPEDYFNKIMKKGKDFIDNLLNKIGNKKIKDIEAKAREERITKLTEEVAKKKQLQKEAKAREERITKLTEEVAKKKQSDEYKQWKREVDDERSLNDWADKRSIGINKMKDEYDNSPKGREERIKKLTEKVARDKEAKAREERITKLTEEVAKKKLTEKVARDKEAKAREERITKLVEEVAKKKQEEKDKEKRSLKYWNSVR